MVILVRTFISVDLSDEFHEKIKDVQSKFNDLNSNLKFVDPLNVHITMKFLGEVSEEKLNDISNALDLVEFNAFDATFQGIGAFPNPVNPKVLWIGCQGDFDGLYGSIKQALSSLGLSGDDHEFTAHITFARVKFIRKKQKAHLSGLLDEMKDLSLGSMHVNSFQLKKSTLTPEGPQYGTLHEVQLK